jgi:hypothetical protein
MVAGALEEPSPQSRDESPRGLDVERGREEVLGRLLEEFGCIELNKDLLDSVKETESWTGAQGGGGGGGLLLKGFRRHFYSQFCFELSSKMQASKANGYLD